MRLNLVETGCLGGWPCGLLGDGGFINTLNFFNYFSLLLPQTIEFGLQYRLGS